MAAQLDEIHLHQASRVLELIFNGGERFNLSCEYLRVYSPSADVAGHGPGQEVLQVGKEDVNISAVEPVGNYAVKLIFDDGHSTGIYTWDYLYDLAIHYEHKWQNYLQRLAAAGFERKEKRLA